MSFLGLRKWPTPVRTFLRHATGPSDIPSQVAKPLWPFVAATGLTWFLVGKMQDLGVKCESPSPAQRTAQ